MQHPRASLRRPPVLAPAADADAFIAATPNTAAANVQVPGRPDVRTSGRRGIVARKDGRQLRRLTVYLPEDVARALTMRCAALDLDLSAFIADAVDGKLAST